MKNKLQVRALADGVPEILVYAPIGDWCDDFVCAKDFAEALASIRGMPRVRVRINSMGGDVFEAFAIVNLLKSCGAQVETVVDGIAASAASLIMCAGSVRSIARNAMVMIHDPVCGAYGCADELRSTADALDKIRMQLVDIYVQASRMQQADVEAAMKAEAYYSADECVTNGLCTRVDGTAEQAPQIDPTQARAALRAHAAEFRRRFAAYQPLPAPQRAPSNGESAMSQNIIRALGLAADAPEADAIAAIGRITARAAALASIETSLGKSGEELVGHIAGLATKAAEFDAVVAQRDAAHAEVARRDREAVLAKYPKKFATPARREFAAKHLITVEALEAFAHTAADALPEPATPPASGASAGGTGVAAIGEKRWEQLTPAEKHNLNAEAPEVYAALRADWVERGKPITTA